MVFRSHRRLCLVGQWHACSVGNGPASVYSEDSSLCQSRWTVQVRRSCDAEKNLNYFLTVTTVVTGKANEIMAAYILGVWRSVRFSGIWSLESGSRFFCWCFWQESGFSRREDVFMFNLRK
jgi:hypothetical protein